MIWIAPSEKDTANATLEKRLWDADDAHASKPEPIQNLRWTRDLLLPRLLSGQVELSADTRTN